MRGKIIQFKEIVSTKDKGFLYGYALFETFYINRYSKIFLFDEHIERMYDSMTFFNFDIEFSKNNLKESVLSYIDKKKIADSVMRVTVSLGDRVLGMKPSISISTRGNAYKEEIYKNGLKLMVSLYKKNEYSPIVNHKTCNYLENLLIGKEASRLGFDDAILLNTNGNIAETTKCNIFSFKNGILYTPTIECGILPGVTRNWVIKNSNKLGILCKCKKISLESILDSDEVFLTNSVIGIIGIKKIDSIFIRSCNGDITRKFINLYTKQSYT